MRHEHVFYETEIIQKMDLNKTLKKRNKTLGKKTKSLVTVLKKYHLAAQIYYCNRI